MLVKMESERELLFVEENPRKGGLRTIPFIIGNTFFFVFFFV